MRITVNNAAEKQLMETFLEALHEEMLEHIQDHDMTLITEGVEPWLGSDEYDFLANGIYNATIDISSIESPMVIESWNIYGVCSDCGTETNGTIDGGDIDLEDFQSMMSPDNLANWKCETCYFKERD